MKSRTSSTRTRSIRPPATLLHRVTIFGGAATAACASAPPGVVAIGRRSAGPRANSRTAAPADRCFWPPPSSGAPSRPPPTRSSSSATSAPPRTSPPEASLASSARPAPRPSPASPSSSRF
ncbi:hypothetical protein VPH35_085830 [Triticum aestivum]